MTHHGREAMTATKALRRRLIAATDRPLGRPALAAVSTWASRRSSGLDVEILYDRAWIHRIGSTYLPVSDRFAYRHDWDSIVGTTLEPIPDYWYHAYRPAAGDTIVDVGAGDGRDSLVFSRDVGARGRVLAIEAHPATFVLLERMCALNGLSNVTPLPYAVMDEPGSVTLVEEGSHRDEFSVIADANGSAAAMEVPAVTLDDLCREQGVTRVDLLKMNIEGAERFALPGAEEVLAHTRHVCVACHDFLAERDPSLATMEFVIEFLRERGFEVILREDHRLPWVRCHVHGIRVSG
jgi:FkbM family methyltransferase